MQPTGRRGSDEDGAAEEEEEGRWHLDEEEDGRRRLDEDEDGRRHLDEEEDGRRRRMRSRLAHDSAGEGCGTPGEEEKIPERERGRGELKKLGGEHITAGSYYNPAVILKHHRRIHLEPAVIYYHRRFETNRR